MTRDPGDEDDGPLASLEAHIDRCATCRPWTLCAAGAALLQRMGDTLAKAMAPEPKRPGAA